MRRFFIVCRLMSGHPSLTMQPRDRSASDGVKTGGRPSVASSEVSAVMLSKHRGLVMLKILTVTAATLAMLSAALAADLPRKEPPPPAAPIGKAPIGKAPIGKAPIGKYPTPVVSKG
jgi:hypothetical protein